MEHRIKSLSPYFAAVLEGRKTFEIRANDRGYNAGDKVVLLEVADTYDHVPGIFTGRSLRADIGYVTGFQQYPGYVVFSLINVE